MSKKNKQYHRGYTPTQEQIRKECAKILAERFQDGNVSKDYNVHKNPKQHAIRVCKYRGKEPLAESE
jgi:hypothetical protein